MSDKLYIFVKASERLPDVHKTYVLKQNDWATALYIDDIDTIQWLCHTNNSKLDFNKIEWLCEIEAPSTLSKGGKEDEWVEVKNDLPPECTVVLGYSPLWIDEDFEPEGIRECFYNNEEWCSAKWDNDQDTWFADYDTKPTHWMQRPKPPIK